MLRGLHPCQRRDRTCGSPAGRGETGPKKGINDRSHDLVILQLGDQPIFRRFNDFLRSQSCAVISNSMRMCGLAGARTKSVTVGDLPRGTFGRVVRCMVKGVGIMCTGVLKLLGDRGVHSMSSPSIEVGQIAQGLCADRDTVRLY